MKMLNKKARFNYELLERFEAGIALLGGEVKSIRKGSVNLTNSYARILENEVYLVNASIPIDGKKDYNDTRIRKLLLNRTEIVSIKTKIKAKRLTLVPTKIYTKRHLVKVEIALAKSKKSHQKKNLIKEADVKRDMERELRGTKGNDDRL